MEDDSRPRGMDQGPKFQGGERLVVQNQADVDVFCVAGVDDPRGQQQGITSSRGSRDPSDKRLGNYLPPPLYSYVLHIIIAYKQWRLVLKSAFGSDFDERERERSIPSLEGRGLFLSTSSHLNTLRILTTSWLNQVSCFTSP